MRRGIVRDGMGLNDSRPAAGNAQSGRTLLPVANLIADSELGTGVSYSSLMVTIAPSDLVSEIFVCDRQTDTRRTTRINAIAVTQSGGTANKR